MPKRYRKRALHVTFSEVAGVGLGRGKPASFSLCGSPMNAGAREAELMQRPDHVFVLSWVNLAQ